MDNIMYFGGLEGGATHSKLVICDQTGEVVGESEGPGTNHWVQGMDQCITTIFSMLRTAKEAAGIPMDRPLDSLALTLSGCEQDSTNEELLAKVKERDENCAKAIYVDSDIAGSLYTGAADGGLVIISGTGSNAMLLTSDGQLIRSGGWGHLLADEGSAFWIALRAVKTVFYHEDGLRLSVHPIDRVWETLRNHFNAKSRADIMLHAYKNFDKPKFAGVTSKLAGLAISGDALSRHLFAEAGASLASLILSLVRHSTEEVVKIVCVGVVWRSWEYLKPGVLAEFRRMDITQDLQFVRLRVSCAMGAAWLAARQVGYDLPRDQASYREVFYTYRPQEHQGASDEIGCGCDDVSW